MSHAPAPAPPPPDPVATCAPAQARDLIRQLPASRIREVANAALGDASVLPFWFGEPDSVTPAFIRDAAKAALNDGDTFYHHNLGLPALRQAISGYLSAHHPIVDSERVVVTSSGVSALMLAAQAILSPGDQVVAVVPLWPNVTEIPRILGAQVDRVGLTLDHATRRWTLDMDRLLASITPRTRAVIVNSPNNPTGWTMRADQMRALAQHCRARGVWILSDEAYERLVFDGLDVAPSMLDCCHPDDRLIVANTFSKTWQMTGWRLGWLTVPPSLTGDMAKLVEFNTSCAPGFVQRAGVAAIAGGDRLIRDFVDDLQQRRNTLVTLLSQIEGIELGIPDGAMYAFFRLAGQQDSLALATRLVRQARLGLAPGIAFGPEGEGFLRWCFARPTDQLEEGVRRLRSAI